MGRDTIATLVVALASLVGTSAARAQDVPATGTLFPAPQVFGLDAAASLEVSDFDLDGQPDLVVGGRTDVIVMTDDGQGGLVGQFLDLQQPGEMRRIHVVDWNADGLPDVAVGRKDSPARVHFGDGTGAVAGSIALQSTPDTTRDIEDGDMDGDGLVDLVLAKQVPKQVQIVHSDGTGGIASSSAVAMPQGVARVALMDVNLDGALDIVASQPSGLEVLLADGPGAYHVVHAADTSTGPRDLIAIDLDGDGREELVESIVYPPSVLIFSVPLVGEFDLLQSYATGALPRATLFSDLDGDGDLDMVVTAKLANVVEIRRGTGALAFGPPEVHPVSANPAAMVIADRDHDGLPDLIIGHGPAAGPPPDITLLSGDGIGNVIGPRRFDVAGGICYGAAVGDLDQDGRLDAVAVTDSSAWVTALLSRNQHELVQSAAVALSGNPRDVALGDVTGDGQLDALVTRSQFAGGLSMLAGDGAGGLSAPVTYPTHGSARALQVADLDGDGAVEVLVTTHIRDSLTVFGADGQGGLAPLTVEYLPIRPGRFALGDLDGNGFLDVVVTSENSTASRILFGRLDGLAFTASDSLPPLAAIAAVTLGDVDLDGDLDLAVAQSVGSIGGISQLRVLTNNGGGAFLPSLLLPTPPVPNDLQVSDLDEDGVPDLLAAASNAVVWHRGLAQGGYEAPRMFAIGSTLLGSKLFDVLPVDLDGDRHLDVLASSTGGSVVILPSRLSSWWNVGGGQPTGPVLWAHGPLEAGSTFELEASGGPAFGVLSVVAGLAPALSPFGSGVVVPQEDASVTLQLDGDGKAKLAVHVPIGTPAGVPFWLQPMVALGGGEPLGDALLGVTR